MNKYTLRQSMLLLLTAAIWGVAFVAQSVGMDYVGPFTFNTVRSLLGGIVLIPCIVLLKRINAGSKDTAGAAEHASGDPTGQRKVLLTGGVACGVLLCIASNLQQFGIMYTSVGKSGFITAMYIVLVPVLGIFLKKKAGIKIWCSVAIAVGGLYLLCMTDSGFSIQKGDLLLLLGAVNIFLPYFDDRLFFTEGGRGENVLHTVFYLWNPVHGRHVPVRTATDRSDPSGMDADRVCRSPVMRSGIYAANCRAEGNEPDRGVPEF